MHLGILSLLSFLPRNSRVSQPTHSHDGHDCGGVPGRCAYSSFYPRYPGCRRSHKDHPQTRGGIFDQQQAMAADQRRKCMTSADAHPPCKRVMENRHCIDRAHPAALAQQLQCIEVRPRTSCKNGNQLKPQLLRQHFEAWVAQSVNSHYIARPQQCHSRACESMLRPIHDKHLFGRNRQPTVFKVQGDSSSLMGPASVRLIAQQRLQISTGASCRNAERNNSA